MKVSKADIHCTVPIPKVTTQGSTLGHSTHLCTVSLGTQNQLDWTLVAW